MNSKYFCDSKIPIYGILFLQQMSLYISPQLNTRNQLYIIQQTKIQHPIYMTGIFI